MRWRGTLPAANIRNGGATINTNGSDITIAQPLLDAGAGGLAKQGAGPLAEQLVAPRDRLEGQLLIMGVLLLKGVLAVVEGGHGRC